MIVFWLLGARMSYQNARVKWSELNLMLPCAISFSFTPESPVLCFLLFGRLWKTEPCSWLFTNHELLLRYASSSRKQQRIICQTCVLFFSWFLPLSFFFFSNLYFLWSFCWWIYLRTHAQSKDFCLSFCSAYKKNGPWLRSCKCSCVL